MRGCGEEMCPNWSGDGRVCPCALFDLDPNEGKGECPDCNGTGFETADLYPCLLCVGSGRVG